MTTINVATKSDSITVYPKGSAYYEFETLDGNRAKMTYVVEGNDLVAKSADKIEYILKATVGTGGVVDAGTHTYTAGNVITLHLAKSGAVGAKPNTWMWRAEDAYNVDAEGKLLPGETEKHYIYMDLEEGDLTTTGVVAGNFNIGGITFSSIEVYKSVNGGEAVGLTTTELAAFADNYNDLIADADLKGRSAVNEQLATAAKTPSEFTFTNFARDGVDTDLYFTDSSNYYQNMDYYKYTTTADDKGVFTGSRLSEIANSTSANETFNLGTNYYYDDEINFSGDFGDDTVQYTEGEQLDLNVKTKGGYNADAYATATVVGDDVVLSYENTFKVTVNVAKAGTVDGHTVVAGDYTLTLAQRGTGAASAAAYDNKYLWRFENAYNVDAEGKLLPNETEKHYIYLDLAKGDFTVDPQTGAITIAKQTIDGLEYSVTGIYHNGQDWTKDFYTAVSAYEDANVADRTYYFENLWKSEVSGTITLKNLGADKIGGSYYNSDNMIEVNGVDLGNLIFTPTKSGSTYAGTRFNDSAESTSAGETFDLKTGSDVIKLSGDFGKDTVKLTKEESVELAFDFNNTIGSLKDVRDVLTYTTSGKDLLVSTTGVDYIVRATVSEDGWVDKEGNVIKKGTYDLHLAKSGEVGAKPNAWMWRMDSAYNTDSTGKIIDGSAEKHYVYLDLEQGDFDTTGSKATIIASNFNMTSGASLKFSKVELIQVVGTGNDAVETVVTDDYYATLAALDDPTQLAQRSALNEAVYDDTQLKGSVILKDYAGKDLDAFVSLADINNNWLQLSMDVQAKNKKFTGTALDDYAESTIDNESFDLKSSMSGDEIKFSGNFGTDTVKYNAGETLNLDFDYQDAFGANTDIADITVLKPNGTSLEISTKGIDYVVRATVSEDGWVDKEGNVIKKGTYDLHLAKSGEIGAKPNSWMWRMDSAYNTDASGKIIDGSTEKHYVYFDLEQGDFDNSGAEATIIASNFNMTSGASLKFSNIEIVQIIGTGEDAVEKVVTDDYYDTLTSLDDPTKLAERSALNEAVYNDTQLKGKVTVSNFAAVDEWGYNKLSLCNTPVSSILNELTAEKGKFTGSVMNDYALSTSANEEFDLKSSMSGTEVDTIDFKGYFGDDTVKLNKGEEIKFNIVTMGGDNATYTYDVDGKDIVITADEVSYAVTVNVAADATVDGCKIAKGNYVLELAKRGTGSASASAYDGKYLWRFEDAYNTDAEGKLLPGETEKHYVYLDLAKGDFTVSAGHVTAIAEQSLAGTDLKYTVTGIYKNDEDWTDGYYATISDYADVDVDGRTAKLEDLWESQVSGSIRLKDYAAKDTGATVYVNSYAEFDPKITATVADVVKGKFKGSAASDVIDATDYVSADGTKGVNFTTGSGNDKVTGTLFNDTVKVSSLEDQTAKVGQFAGTNKVTFGKGDDFFYAGDYDATTDTYTAANVGYSSNTVNMGVGDNTAKLNTYGTNKVTAKDGDNDITMYAGVNTVKVGNATKKNLAGVVVGHNDFTIDGGQNKVTSGKGVDNYDINDGYNTISSGNGKDTFDISGGYNTIKTGADDKTFTISDGTNIITTGKGNDTFVFTANNGTSLLKGGAGNDTYDVSALIAPYTNDIFVNDTKGTNTLKLAAKDTVFFDVTIKTDKNGKLTSYKAGTDLLFTNNAITTVADMEAAKGVNVSGKNAITNVTVGYDEYTLDVSDVASEVAKWLATNKFASTTEAFAQEPANIDKLVAIFTDNSASCYKA